MSMHAAVSGHGESAMADQDVCIAVGEDLMRAYPGYPWSVGVCHEAGTVVIDLAVSKPIGMEQYAYQLYLSTVFGPGGQKRVMQAGGELLERFGLRRTFAHEDTREMAAENGLDISSARNKSKDEKWV